MLTINSTAYVSCRPWSVLKVMYEPSHRECVMYCQAAAFVTHPMVSAPPAVLSKYATAYCQKRLLPYIAVGVAALLSPMHQQVGCLMKPLKVVTDAPHTPVTCRVLLLGHLYIPVARHWRRILSGNTAHMNPVSCIPTAHDGVHKPTSGL